MNTAHWMILLGSALFGSAAATAQTAPPLSPGEDDPIPPALKVEHYESLWLNSPFTRPLNAAESYVLTSVARIDGKSLVTLLNTATRERFTLSTDNNSQGWRLIDLHPDPNPKNIVARISVNGEEVTVRFGDEQLSAQALLKAAQGAGPQPAPQPGTPGGNANVSKGIQGQGKNPANGHGKGQKKENKSRNPKS